MQSSLVFLLATAGGALAAAIPPGDKAQKPLGSFATASSATQQDTACEATYGPGWRRCGDDTSKSCYNPELGHTCCSVDNSYCTAGTWCAPVAGFCCLNTEDLETCARNAGFELPAK